MRRRISLTHRVAVRSDVLAELVVRPERLSRDVVPVLGARVLEHEGDVAIIELELAGRIDPLQLELVRLDAQSWRFSQVDRFANQAINGVLAFFAVENESDVSIDIVWPAPLFGRHVRRVRAALIGALDAINRTGVSQQNQVILRFESLADRLTLTIDGRRFLLVLDESA